MNAFNPTQAFSLTRDPIFAQINDEIVVMSPKNEENYAINPVGTKLWNLLQTRPMSLNEMVQYLTECYEVTIAVAMQDVADFLKTMMEHDLVSPVN